MFYLKSFLVFYSMGKLKGEKFYGVHKGKGGTCGVFKTWNEVAELTMGIKGSSQKSFRTEAEALEFSKRGHQKTKTRACKSKEVCRGMDSITLEFLSAKNMFPVFTDGSCIGNGRVNAPGGIGVWLNIDHPKNHSGHVPDTTNQRTEMLAVFKAFDIFDGSQNEFRSSQKIKDLTLHIITDSMYVINKAAKIRHFASSFEIPSALKASNYNLVINLYHWLKRYPGTKFSHVNSHVGIFGNDEADKLAKRGAMSA